MNLRQLELFVALAKDPSISRVSRDNFLSQGAVSVALKGLEEELGVRLFDRLNRRLTLNDNGRDLIRHLEPALQRLNEALHIFEGDHMSGTLVLGASSTIADYILPQLIYEFNIEYPQVQVEVNCRHPRDIVQGVADGSVDLGFIEVEAIHKDIDFTRLYEDELFVVTADKEFAEGGPYPFTNLLDKKWVLREPGAGARQTFELYAGRYLRKLDVVFEPHHTEAVKRMLQNPDTLSCLSPFAVARELEAGELFVVPLEDMRFGRYFWALEHEDKYHTRLIADFKERVEKALQNKVYEEVCPYEGPLSVKSDS